MSSSRKIQATKNYRLFSRHEGENRALDLKKHKALYDSMKLYGFLPSYPIVCYRDPKGNLVYKDGQHRAAIAEELGLTIYWVEESIDFDVAIVNSTAKVWTVKDYADKWAANGLKQYVTAMDFASQHHISPGLAFAMLSGTTSYGNVKEEVQKGEFKITDAAWANAVAGIYSPLVSMSSALRKDTFLAACMAVCRVPDFDAKRLIGGAERCREKLVSYGTRDAFLDMIETVYNFGRKQLVSLKNQAITVMRDRNASVVAKKTKAAKTVAA